MVRQHVKLTVVLVAVVLALTGFSSSSSGGKGGSKSRSGKSKSSSSGGGGCSSSKKSNGTYHDTDSDYDDYSSSSGSSGSTSVTPTATATDAPQAYVFRCASPRKGKRKAVTTSTVRLTANAPGSHSYEVDVTFLDAAGNTVDTGEATVEADGGETKTVSVRMSGPGKVSRVRKCSVTAELSY